MSSISTTESIEFAKAATRSGVTIRINPSLFQFGADIIAFTLSIGVYYYLRFYSGWFQMSIVPNLATDWIVFIPLVAYWLILFWFSGLYKNWYVRAPFDEFFTAMRISFLGTLIMLFVIMVDDKGGSAANSRLIVFYFWFFLSVSVCTGRLAARYLQRYLRTKGLIQIPVILIGTAEKLRDLLTSIINTPSLGYVPLGVVLRDRSECERWQAATDNSQQLPALGSVDEIRSILRTRKPQEALVAMDSTEHDTLLTISARSAEMNVAVKIVPDLYEIFSGQARTMPIYGVPLIEVSPQLMKPWEEAAKRTLDIVFSIVVLVVGAPIWLLLALIIRLDSTGPALFSQLRAGKNGKSFTIYKFRSMTTGSDKNGPSWTKVNDPRVTRFGRFMRKTHLDEIPQFWNVLKGEMSLVGPRPELVAFVEKFSEAIPYYPRRLKVRPGITGWWQIKYKDYEESLDEVRDRLRYDFFYIENMSFQLDLEILARTVIRVFKGHGQA